MIEENGGKEERCKEEEEKLVMEKEDEEKEERYEEEEEVYKKNKIENLNMNTEIKVDWKANRNQHDETYKTTQNITSPPHTQSQLFVNKTCRDRCEGRGCQAIEVRAIICKNWPTLHSAPSSIFYLWHPSPDKPQGMPG